MTEKNIGKVLQHRPKDRSLQFLVHWKECHTGPLYMKTNLSRKAWLTTFLNKDMVPRSLSLEGANNDLKRISKRTFNFELYV